MQATRIIAIRHGETAWNVDTRIQGQLDIGLNETGRQQAKRLARALASESIQAIYASDLSRARDTARSIAHTTGQAVQTHEGLRERGFGVFQGKTFAEIETIWPEQAQRWRKRDPLWAPQGGESLVDVRERITRTASELAARHLGEQIVLVAHGGVMDVLYRAATGQEIQAPRSWALGNTAINRLLWTPEGMTLVGWSDTRHLDDDATLDETST
ncbi:histidine phosphatase family protein [Rhodoferax sp. UBA5149]|uniref:histidine phosphatase family protein n=1 Tax=Rhodoferax sp. UBA5149 TaxID=1947379 RepID=UPI0025E05882|nr:histidine phosphatase family protein [Rhodoferax sp. UBA5149]